MSEIDPELVSLAHMCFQEHMPDAAAPELCVCLRAHPCPLRSWAIGYLVRAGRLILARQPAPPARTAGSTPALGGRDV